MSNYSYPTKEEWIKVSEEFPDIVGFGFPHVDQFKLLWDSKKTITEVHLLQNLFYWDNLLNKKIWNLKHSYVNAITNYNRGIALKSEDYKDEMKTINFLQYEYYCETTFYYLISTRDIIFQIINLAFELGLSEKRAKGKPSVDMNTLIAKVRV